LVDTSEQPAGPSRRATEPYPCCTCSSFAELFLPSVFFPHFFFFLFSLVLSCFGSPYADFSPSPRLTFFGSSFFSSRSPLGHCRGASPPHFLQTDPVNNRPPFLTGGTILHGRTSCSSEPGPASFSRDLLPSAPFPPFLMELPFLTHLQCLTCV